jgi:amino acid transporter
MEASPQRVSALRGGSVGIGGAVVQSAALIGPGAGATVGLVFVGSQTGFASPFAMVIGMIFSLCLAVVIGEFARKLPAAGSFYTYLSQAFGAKTGFVTGVLLFGAYLLLLPFQLAFFGTFVSSYLDSQSVHLAWQWPAIALILLTTGLGIAGIAPTLRAGLIALAFEIVVFSVIAIAILIKGGDSGLSLKPFDPSQSFDGFSGVLFYTLLIYSGVVGFGLNARGLHQLQTDSAPFNTLAGNFVGSWLATLSTLAVISSFIALNIVTVSAASRMIFAMGRDRLMPSFFHKVNARHAPGRAVLAVSSFAIAVTLILGSAYAPGDLASWAAYIATLFFIAAYGLLVVGVTRFYLRQYRDEFSIVRHGVIPLAGLIGVGIVTYGNVHPRPPSPLRYFIWATIAVIVIATLIAIWLENRNPRLLVEAGQLFASAAPDEDLDDPARPATAPAAPLGA